MDILPLHTKIESVSQYPRPPKKKEMRAFLGLTNYYRCFIPAYGSIVVPLTDVTRKTSPDVIAWMQEMGEAFEQLKIALTNDPVLASLNESKMFVLRTDASGIGIGAVLSQEGNEGMDHPVAYFSRRLKPAETCYSVTEQECLSVVGAIRHFKIYFSGSQFRVVADHRSLSYLARMKKMNADDYPMHTYLASFHIHHRASSRDTLSER